MNRTYKCNSINWYLYTIILITIFNFAGLLILILYGREITIGRIFVHTALAVFFIFIAYLRHVTQIKFVDDGIIIYRYFKKYNDLAGNLYVLEKIKVTRTLHKYRQLVIKSTKLNKIFKIDSDDWNDYEEIKEILLETSMMEDINE